MPTYVVPQPLVFQEVDLVPAAQVQTLPALIAGGHAELIRHSESDEKNFGLLGQYDRLQDTDYDWPGRPAGGTVDQAYTMLHIDDALLRYFSDVIGAGDSIATVAGETNKIKAAATNFKANGTTYPRDSDLLDRDVKIGDVVKTRAVVGSDTYDLCTYVRGIEANVVAAVVQDATDDSSNQATTTLSTGSSKTGGAENCVNIDSVDGSAYDGLLDGDVTETYTVRVIASSAGGDATTARLRITSASGNDDVASATPAAFGSPTDIGIRGLTVTFENDCTLTESLSALNEAVDNDDFIVGQIWTVTVTQAYTTTAATSGGSYDGESDDIYIIEVTRGGVYSVTASLAPQITVRTTRGTDVSGPHNVTAAATAVAIGTHGVTVSFDESALVKGDRFYVECDAESYGAYQTLVLGHNFDEEVIANGATQVDLELFIRKDIDVPANRIGYAPLTNWEQSETQITIKSGIIAQDDSWTDSGVLQDLEVYADCEYSNMYLTVRYWLSDLCNEVNTIYDVSDLDDAISGPLHPDNELKYAMLKALQNNNGRPVSYIGVCDPSVVAEWAGVLELVDGRRDAYGLVPLTRNATVWSLFQGHTGTQSAAEFGRWRVAWFNTDGIPEKVVVDDTLTADEDIVMAVLEDDPFTSGTQYTYLRATSSNSQFVTLGVQAGDIVRFLFGTDGFGTEEYLEFAVDTVVNEQTIRLLTGHTAAVSVAERVEVWRNLTATEQAAELALTHGYTDRRVRMVWPDEIESDGYTVNGYHLCAALAALTGAVAPHQGLTRLAISGFSSATRTTGLFNRTQLNTMAGGGVWIVTQDLEVGTIFTRHAVTTGATETLSDREEMVVRNLDSISFYFQDVYDPYIGISNVTPSAIEILRSETLGAIKFLESANFIPRLGPQLINGTINELRAHHTNKDRILIDLGLELPFPLNTIEVHLRLVA